QAPPETVPPVNVSEAESCAVVATASVPPFTFSSSSHTRLWIDCVPEGIWMVGLAATEMVTSSFTPGSDGLLDQFPGEVQRLSPAAPVQLTALSSRRASSVSQTSSAARRTLRRRRSANRARAAMERLTRTDAARLP